MEKKPREVRRFRGHAWRHRFVMIGWLAVALVMFLPVILRAEDKAPSAILAALAAGRPQEVIVLFDDTAIQAEAIRRKRQAGIAHDDATVLSFKAERYRDLKKGALSALLSGEGIVIREYSHLPMLFQRFNSRAALERLLARPEVVAVFENRPVYPVLAHSLPFIDQPLAASRGMTGSGTTVAVIDTGINYTLADFGSCTTPGIPAGCRVIASVDVTGNGVTLNTDPNNHGTNVAGIVAGVAPGSHIAAVNAFSGGNSSFAWVIDGINWAIANKAAYSIAAINMSLGDGTDYTSPCANSHTNPFVTPVNNARSAGLIPVAAAGNSAYTDGISNPACTPGVVSVGAVYDANWGGPYTWSNCTDTAASAPDVIPCFSNSTSFLTMLAPGAFITAAGIQMAGTSQASPHVAGAVAVLRAAFPADTLDQTVARMVNNGVSITDPRNGITKPRLNLLDALGAPANDNFAAAPALGGNSGQLTADNTNASKESGEPNHAGNPGGKSVWWNWTPSSSGLARIDTHGSSFDTLLAVYTGASVSALTQIAANGNDGSTGNTSGLTFQAQAGTKYMIAVDGYNGAFGAITLDWSLTLQADLAVTMTQDPASPVAGSNLTWSMTVTNNGPSTATGVVLTDPLPAGVTFVSSSAGCSLSTGTVSCVIGTLASGGEATVQVIVTPTQAGSLSNSVAVSSDIQDPMSANNSATFATTVTTAAAPAVPALSPWGIIGTAGLLLLGVVRGTRYDRRREE